MNEFGKKGREERLTKSYNGVPILSDRAYNGLMGTVVAYGLIVNILMCIYCTEFAMQMNPWVLLIGYFALSIIGIFIAGVSDNPIVSFIGYNLLVCPVGLVLSLVVDEYGGIDSMVVVQAFFLTLLITSCMIVLSICYPDFFNSLGKTLFCSLLGIIIARLVCLFTGWDTTIIAWFSAIIFSLYIGYDFNRSQQFVKTMDNAVDCALDIYLDIINLFLDILQILGKKKD